MKYFKENKWFICKLRRKIKGNLRRYFNYTTYVRARQLQRKQALCKYLYVLVVFGKPTFCCYDAHIGLDL